LRFADCVTLLREKRGVGEASGLRPFASDRKKGKAWRGSPDQNGSGLASGRHAGTDRNRDGPEARADL